MPWPCTKNGAHITCKNRIDLDPKRTKEKGAPANKHGAEHGTRRELKSVAIGLGSAARLAQGRTI